VSLSAAEAVGCEIKIIGWVGDWVVFDLSNAFLAKQYLRKYDRSKVETLHVDKSMVGDRCPSYVRLGLFQGNNING